MACLEFKSTIYKLFMSLEFRYAYLCLAVFQFMYLSAGHSIHPDASRKRQRPSRFFSHRNLGARQEALNSGREFGLAA
jgi:hypothetical protein